MYISDNKLENPGGDGICWMLCANIFLSFAESLWCLLTLSRAFASAKVTLG